MIHARPAEVVPGRDVVVHLPEAGMAGGVVAPEDVGGAVAVVVADAGDLVINPGAAEIEPGLGVVVHVPDADMAAGIVAPQDVGGAVAVEIADADHPVIGAGAAEIAPGLRVVVHLPDADMAGRIVAPQHVGGAVAVEIADAGHLVVGAGAAEVAPGLHIVVHLPDSGVAGGLVAPKQIRRAVAVEVADADHLVVGAGAAEVGPAERVVVHLPDAGMAARIIAPENVRGAVAVEVADAGHPVICAGAAEVVPGRDAVVHQPVADVSGRVVAPEHVRGAVAVEVVARLRFRNDKRRRGLRGVENHLHAGAGMDAVKRCDGGPVRAVGRAVRVDLHDGAGATAVFQHLDKIADRLAAAGGQQCRQIERVALGLAERPAVALVVIADVGYDRRPRRRQHRRIEQKRVGTGTAPGPRRVDYSLDRTRKDDIAVIRTEGETGRDDAILSRTAGDLHRGVEIADLEGRARAIGAADPGLAVFVPPQIDGGVGQIEGGGGGLQQRVFGKAVAVDGLDAGHGAAVDQQGCKLQIYSLVRKCIRGQIVDGRRPRHRAKKMQRCRGPRPIAIDDVAAIPVGRRVDKDGHIPGGVDPDRLAVEREVRGRGCVVADNDKLKPGEGGQLIDPKCAAAGKHQRVGPRAAGQAVARIERGRRTEDGVIGGTADHRVRIGRKGETGHGSKRFSRFERLRRLLPGTREGSAPA